MNITIPISAHLVPPDKVESLNTSVLRRVNLLQTHVVSQHLSISREEALAILQLIALKVEREKVFLIYHNDCPDAFDAFVDERPVREGLPSFPYTCPICENTITDEYSLSYDVAIRIPKETEIRIESLHL